MAKFRKKPVVIEAIQFVMPMNEHMPQWLTEAFQKKVVTYSGGYVPTLTVKTLEGDHVANEGDWIIQGVKGEIYPCKPDIFAMTYDAVEE